MFFGTSICGKVRLCCVQFSVGLEFCRLGQHLQPYLVRIMTTLALRLEQPGTRYVSLSYLVIGT